MSPSAAPQPTPVDLAICLASSLFWTLAYILIIRRSHRDRSFGIPAAVLCCNVAWEGLVAFNPRVPSPLHEVAVAWFLLDLVIWYQCFRNGPEDYAEPLVRRWFRPWLVAGLLGGLAIQWAFITGYGDYYGRASGTINGLILAIQFPAMLLRRQSVRGQSFYIMLCILLGNSFGYAMTLMPYAPPPEVPHRFIHAAFISMILLHVFYLVLVWQQCRREGINPLRRL